MTAPGPVSRQTTASADSAPEMAAGHEYPFRLRRRFILMLAAFSLAIAILVGLSYVGFQALSGARAYVHGESQWAKAQKQAVISLLQYADSGEPVFFEQHHRALAVTRGDRRARQTLDEASPDYDIARKGFLAGRNHPDDIDLMIRTFQFGRHLELFDQAVDAWRRGDELIDALTAEALALRDAVDNAGAGSEPVQAHIDEILVLDAELTLVEEQFSELMRQVSNQLALVVEIALVLTAAILIIAGSLLTWRLLRSSERAEQALFESEQRYRALVDQPSVGMWQLDENDRVTYLNPAMKLLLGLETGENPQGVDLQQFVRKTDRPALIESRRERRDGKSTTTELELIPRDGQPRKVLIHGAPIYLGKKQFRGHVGTCIDITDRKAAEEKLRFQAFHDPLTSLPNRTLFMDRLEMAIRRARRNKATLAVLFVDIDRFKIVNDSLGHITGDSLLREAAQRLASVMRSADTIARFGGDEFGIIIENIARDDDAITPARRIIEVLTKEFDLGEINAQISASIGIALSSHVDEPAADLLRHADIAMYAAKRKGGKGWHIYDPEHDFIQKQQLQFESELRSAAENGELRVVYQPIVDITSGRTSSMEALVRWQHPTRGLMAPSEFIPLAEETGAIESIGQWVTRRACLDLLDLRKRLGDTAPDSVSVNISEAEFRLGNPIDHIEQICHETGMTANSLRFEVTESLLTRNPAAVDFLEGHGFAVSIDDFGTGFSSFDRIRNISFSAIKIDRSFINGMTHGNVDQALVEAIIYLGRRLDKEVIAEGIENEDQRNALIRLGCQLGQGYLFARPLPIDDLIEYLGDL